MKKRKNNANIMKGISNKKAKPGEGARGALMPPNKVHAKKTDYNRKYYKSGGRQAICR